MEATHTSKVKRAPGPLYFLIANFLYLVVVQGLSLTIQPVGRDFEVFAGASPLAGAWIAPVLESVFGDSVALYHVLNLALLYGAMCCVFLLTRLLVQGPWWLGSLTAALLMANPLKSEAIYQLSGFLDMLPAFLGLLSITLYVVFAVYHRKAACAGAVAAHALAVFLFPQTWGLLLVLIAYEAIVLQTGKDALARLAPFGLVSLAALFVGVQPEHWWSGNVLETFTPLYFVFYPIGILPSTEAWFLAETWVWVAACVVILALSLAIGWGAQSRALSFGLLASVAFRLIPAQPVDLVHMAGGGQMIIPIALMNIAFAALCWRMLQHKKWVRSVVFLTTALCILFFVLQIRELFAWRHGAQQALAFQARTWLSMESGADTVAIVPDFTYYRTAPIQVGEAVRWDSRFSIASPAVPLLRLRYDRPGRLFTEVVEHSPERLHIAVKGGTPEEILPRQFEDLLPDGVQARITTTPDGFDIHLVSTRGDFVFPQVIVPYRNGQGLP